MVMTFIKEHFRHLEQNKEQIKNKNNMIIYTKKKTIIFHMSRKKYI